MSGYNFNVNINNSQLEKFHNAAAILTGGGEIIKKNNEIQGLSVRGRLCTWIRNLALRIGGRADVIAQEKQVREGHRLETLETFKTALSEVYGTRAAENAKFQIETECRRDGLTPSLLKKAVVAAESFHGKGEGRRMERSATIKIWPWGGLRGRAGHAAVLVKDRSKTKEERQYISFWPAANLGRVPGGWNKVHPNPALYSTLHREVDDFQNEMGSQTRDRLDNLDRCKKALKSIEEPLTDSTRYREFNNRLKEKRIDEVLEQYRPIDHAEQTPGVFSLISGWDADLFPLEVSLNLEFADLLLKDGDSQNAAGCFRTAIANLNGEVLSIDVETALKKALDKATGFIAKNQIAEGAQELLGFIQRNKLHAAQEELKKVAEGRGQNPSDQNSLREVIGDIDRLCELDSESVLRDGETLLEKAKEVLQNSIAGITPRPQQQYKEGSGWGQRPDKFCLPLIGMNQTRTSKEQSGDAKVVFFGLDEFAMIRHANHLKTQVQNTNELAENQGERRPPEQIYRYYSKEDNCASKALEMLIKGGADAFVAKPSAIIAYTPNDVSAFAIAIQEEVDRLNGAVNSIRSEAEGVNFQEEYSGVSDAELLSTFTPAAQQAFEEISRIHDDRFIYADQPDRFDPKKLLGEMKKIVETLKNADGNDAGEKAEVLRRCEICYLNILGQLEHAD